MDPGIVSRFSKRNLSKLDKVYAFQKQNASNESNTFFLNKIEEEFLRLTFNIQRRNRPNLTKK